MPYGIVGLLILVLDVYVIYRVMTNRMDPGMKLLWVILVLLLPLVGPILYFLIAEKRI
ncbi:MAG TPA: PLDc N-terminal domain-containing protein [Phycisphaerae bacterium]|jgi:hypothetical protein|nr:PLDc N-terminal domain-containing protein [Phycisphaerae bacterium]